MSSKRHARIHGRQYRTAIRATAASQRNHYGGRCGQDDDDGDNHSHDEDEASPDSSEPDKTKKDKMSSPPRVDAKDEKKKRRGKKNAPLKIPVFPMNPQRTPLKGGNEQQMQKQKEYQG